MFIPRMMPKLDSKIMERIRAEEKVELPPQRKMEFCRRLEAEDSDEVSESNAVFKKEVTAFDEIYRVQSPRAIKQYKELKAKGHQFWSISPDQLERW